MAGDDSGGELNLNQDLETGAIASSRLWLDDQLGVNSCDLSFSELDPLRGRAGASAAAPPRENDKLMERCINQM